ncbi:hypothetical protein Tco_0511865 [Tanacetum coccineum]
MLNSDSIDTTIVEKIKLDEDLQGTPVDATLYSGMIGSLMYLTSSRPDLIYAVCLYAWYQAKPTEKLLNVVNRIFRYLKGTINMGLWYLKDTVGLPRSKMALRSRVQRQNILPYLGVKKIQFLDREARHENHISGNAKTSDRGRERVKVVTRGKSAMELVLEQTHRASIEASKNKGRIREEYHGASTGTNPTRNWVNTSAVRIIKMIADIAD